MNKKFCYICDVELDADARCPIQRGNSELHRQLPGMIKYIREDRVKEELSRQEESRRQQRRDDIRLEKRARAWWTVRMVGGIAFAVFVLVVLLS